MHPGLRIQTNPLPFFKFRLARLERANPDLKKRKVGWRGGFTQGGGLGGLALGWYAAPFQGAGGIVSAGAHRAIGGRGEPFRAGDWGFR